MREYSTERIFYVYHHINENSSFGEVGCRNIGKGCHDRAFIFRGRNPYWNHVFTKDNRPTVVLIAENLTEEEAFAIEIQQIAFAKEHGVKLCNLTDGGEGMSNPSFETRQKLIKSHTGKRDSDETRKRKSDALIGKHNSDETRKRKSDAAIGNQYGKGFRSKEACKNIKDGAKKRPPVSLKTRQKQSESAKKKPRDSEETRRKKSEGMKGKQNWKGKK